PLSLHSFPTRRSSDLFLGGFALVWHINWLAIASIVGIIGVVVARMFDEDTEYVIPAAEVEKMELAQLQKIKELKAQQKPEEEDIDRKSTRLNSSHVKI